MYIDVAAKFLSCLYSTQSRSDKAFGKLVAFCIGCFGA